MALVNPSSPDVGQYWVMDLYVRPTQVSGAPAIVLRRSFDATAEDLWELVSTSGGLATWFPSPDVQIEAFVGGQITLSGDPYADTLVETIDQWAPPREWTFGWGGDTLHITVDPETEVGRAALILVDTLLDPQSAALNAAGWHACSDRIATHFGEPEPEADWPEYFEAYAAAGLASGTKPPADA